MEVKEKHAEDLIRTIVDKINSHSDKLKGWTGAFQIVFKDANTAYLIKVSDNGTVEKAQKTAVDTKNSDTMAGIITTTDTLQSVLDGTTSPISAVVKGQIQVEGSLGNLMKLGAAFMQK